MGVCRKNEGAVNWRNSKLREKRWDLVEPAVQDWSALSAEAIPSEVPAKQIYFTPV